MSRDIRSFFGGVPANTPPATSQSSKKRKADESTSQPSRKRTAITDEADLPVTPKQKRPKSAKIEAKKPIIELDSDVDSDPEEPLPSKFRKKTKQRIIASDSEEEYFDKHSASRMNDSPKASKEPLSKRSSPKKVLTKKPSPKQLPTEKPTSEKNEPPIKKVPSKQPVNVPSTKKVPSKQLIPVKTATNVPATPNLEPALDLRTPAEKLEQWVDKYRPTSIATIMGQHTDQAPAKKLMRWLKDWPRHNLGLKTTKKTTAMGASAKNDGSAFRAALLSGPPGIGKTTTATVVCEELGLRYIELNASAARSKKALDDKVSQLIHSRRVDEYFGERRSESKPVIKSKSGIKVTHVLIMDEVDGMSGNQDRAGVAEVIKFIKTAEIPIICICNDRHSQKVRSLANYCFDLQFTRPRVEQILSRMMTITAREKIKIPKEEMEQIIKASNQDMRQSIYSLQLLSAGQDHKNVVQAKDVSINIFEAARQILTIGTDVRKKRDLFFTDYSLMPLFVQENYLRVRSSTLGRQGQMRAFRDAAESIAMGDMVNRQIWSSQDWSLLPLQGMLSCAVPALQLSGYLTGQLSFPAFLGKRSNMTKRLRLLRELDEHMGLKMSGPLHAISTDYIPVIRNAILKPLLRGDKDNIEDALDVYHAYDLVKEDLDSINELGMWSEKDDLWKNVKPAVKASLTRALGKDTHKKHHATLDDVKIQPRTTAGKRATAKEARAKVKEIAAAEQEEEEDQDEFDDAEAQAEILNAY